MSPWTVGLFAVLLLAFISVFVPWWPLLWVGVAYGLVAVAAVGFASDI